MTSISASGAAKKTRSRSTYGESSRARAPRVTARAEERGERNAPVFERRDPPLDERDDVHLADEDRRAVRQARDEDLIVAFGRERVDLRTREPIERAGFDDVDVAAEDHRHVGDD